MNGVEDGSECCSKCPPGPLYAINYNSNNKRCQCLKGNPNSKIETEQIEGLFWEICLI